MTIRILVCVFILIASSFAFARDIPFTQDDRDRLIRVEEGLRAVNQRIDGVEKRIEVLENLMYVLIFAIFVQTVGVVGFVLWDRRTMLSPVAHKAREMEEREERIERALKEMARTDKKTAEILRRVGIL